MVVTEKKSCAGLLSASGLSVITACKMTSLSRASFYRRRADWREKDKAVIDAIQAVLSESPQAGFWKCYYRLKFKCFTFNHKRVYRVYCRLGLNLKRRLKMDYHNADARIECGNGNMTSIELEVKINSLEME